MGSIQNQWSQNDDSKSRSILNSKLLSTRKPRPMNDQGPFRLPCHIKPSKEKGIKPIRISNPFQYSGISY